jgi:hypothetical protein
MGNLMFNNPEYGNPDGTLNGRGQQAALDFLSRKSWMPKEVVQNTPWLQDAVNGVSEHDAYHGGFVGGNIYSQVGKYSTNPKNQAAYSLAMADKAVDKYAGDDNFGAPGLRSSQKVALDAANILGLDTNKLRSSVNSEGINYWGEG